VDVTSEVLIERPPGVVFAYVCDPANATAWHANVASAEWRTDPRVHVGSQVAFVADFLGRRLEYVYELVEVEPGEKLVMRSVEGPFPLETVYTFEETREGHTRMTLRNHGEPSGVSKLMTPMIATALRSANEKDLGRLKAILEGHGSDS
jgi:uncharacterized protein YndB with AHSA1/START domain